MSIITYSTTLILETCCNCSIPFGMSETLYHQRLDDGKQFYCPNGHPQHYTKRENLEAKLKAARARAQHLDDQLEATQRSRNAYKGIVTKTRKKLAEGACPAGCHATFPDLASHLAAEHPGYLAHEDHA